MLHRNIYNSKLHNITSRKARSVCHSLPTTNTSANASTASELSDKYCITDDGYIFSSEEERNNFLIRSRLFQQAGNYYDRYTHEIVLSFDNHEYQKRQPSNEEALPPLKRAVIRVYQKLYGKHNVRGMKFDYYAVLERKNKNGTKTHAHWHVLLHFPSGRKRHELTEGLVSKSWTYKRQSIGRSWVREVEMKPMTNVRLYIYDYLTKDPNAYHYNGGKV